MRRVRLHRRPSGPRARLLLPLAFAAVFLLVPAGQALADHGGGENPHLTVNLIGEEGGGGEVQSENPGLSGPAGAPPIRCFLPEGEGAEQETKPLVEGEGEGACENEMDEVEEGVFGVRLATGMAEAPNSDLVKFEVVKGLGIACGEGAECTVASAGADAEVNVYFECEEGKVCGVPLTLAKTGEGDGTVTSSPAGIECAPGCEGEEAGFAEGTAVTLTAVPDGESSFDGWTGCEAEPEPGQCEVTMNEAKEVEAEFGEKLVEEFELTVDVSGEGKVDADSGAIAGCREASGTCTDEYVEGTLVTFEATPDPGHELAGWEGCDSEPGGDCQVTMNEAREVKAAFAEEPDEEEGGDDNGGDDNGGGSTPPPPPPPPPPVQTCLTNPLLCRPGVLIANGLAPVKGNVALLKVRCRGEVGARCRGVAKLFAKLPAANRKGKRAKGSARNRRRARLVAIGKTRYNLPTGSAVRTIRTRLTGKGARLVRRAGRRGLKAKLAGKGVRNRAVKLKQQGGGKKQRRRARR